MFIDDARNKGGRSRSCRPRATAASNHGKSDGLALADFLSWTVEGAKVEAVTGRSTLRAGQSACIVIRYGTVHCTYSLYSLY